MRFWTFLAALALACVGALPHALRSLPRVPRARFLSFAGGASLSFVVLRLLPALGEEEALVRAGGALTLPLPAGEQVYGVVLLSILLFYAAEVLSRRTLPDEALRTPPARGLAVVIEIGSFACLSFLVGFTLMHRARAGWRELLMFSVAMFLKFIVSDHALHGEHGREYDRAGRWVLAGAVLAGWALGAVLVLPGLGPVLLEAFIAGGVIFNVLRWEVPRSQAGRYGWFLLGTLAYAGLLLAIY